MGVVLSNRSSERLRDERGREILGRKILGLGEGTKRWRSPLHLACSLKITNALS